MIKIFVAFVDGDHLFLDGTAYPNYHDGIIDIFTSDKYYQFPYHSVLYLTADKVKVGDDNG